MCRALAAPPARLAADLTGGGGGAGKGKGADEVSQEKTAADQARRDHCCCCGCCGCCSLLCRVWRAFERGASARFEQLMLVCISCNTVLMACYHLGLSEQHAEAMDGASTLFAGVFTVELCIKLTGLGLPKYLRSSWNRFDCAVVVATDTALALKWWAEVDIGPGATVVRALRVVRVVRLVQRAEGLRKVPALPPRSALCIA